MPRLSITALILASALVAGGCKTNNGPASASSTPERDVTISLNASAIEQEMGGWEVPILGTARDYLGTVPVAQEVFNQAVNDLGLTRLAISVFPGMESASGACQQHYFDGSLSEDNFVRTCAYSPTNDNDDPSVIDPNGFHWDLFDWEMDRLVLPMKRAMDARGEPFYLDTVYVDFAAASFEPQTNPAEYAEFVLALFQHMQAKYGFVPAGHEIINEPDLAPDWADPAMVGRLAAATGARLRAAGFTPELIVPSTTDKGNAAPYLETIMNQPGAREYVKEIGWHCYKNSDPNSSAAIGAVALAYGVRSALTECWTTGNTYESLHHEIKTSRNGMWSMGTIHGVHGYYAISNGTITLRDRAKYMRQYYKYVRPGAKRIGVASSNPNYDPVAFINTDGRYVVVVKASAAGTFTIHNLPAGTYGIYSTTGPNPSTVTAFDVTAPDQTVTAGGRLTTSIQGQGVITIFARGQGSSGRSAS
ncbi:MAG: glycoside hydrolase family 30 beta sandwich domain-containing protein [Vicinamibacterales bacterium]